MKTTRAAAGDTRASAIAAPSPKRARFSSDEPLIAGDTSVGASLVAGLSECLPLLPTSANSTSPSIPPSLAHGAPTGNSISKLRSLFDAHGFRTSVVSSPREALSIYRDSCILGQTSENDSTYAGKKFLLSMLGLHPYQNEIEQCYASSVGEVHRLILFCSRLREACGEALGRDGKGRAGKLLEEIEGRCHSVAATFHKAGRPSSPHSVASVPPSVSSALSLLVSAAPELVADLVSAVVLSDHRLRPEQLRREYDRIAFRNATYANALVQLFVDAHGLDIKDVYFKRSHVAKYERITVYLYDPEIDPLRPPRFTFLPALRRAIDDGPERVADDMAEEFWDSLLRGGYFATEAMKAELTPELRRFFMSGIANDPTVPLLLNAHFSPKYPLSLYLHGKAGAGKSSFVRNFSPAFNAAVEGMADPETLVRFVKQNLNKPQKVLDLEMELRPNNNDLSVMSIIQGRRMTLAQTKPGLVVVGFEEMASNAAGADPNQLRTCRLLSQRFSGRNGDFKSEKKGGAPRNSAKRGISGDASVVTLFTSNYELVGPCSEALRRLEMFSNIKSLETVAVAGEDRVAFAKAYLRQSVQDWFCDVRPECDIDLDIPLGSGDTRPMVRHLRMLAFHLCAMVGDGVNVGSVIEAKIEHLEKSETTVISWGGERVELREGPFENLYPKVPQTFDSRTKMAIEALRTQSGPGTDFSELSQIVDYYFAKTLAPAVVVSTDAELIRRVVSAVSRQEGVHCIEGVDPGSYKMMKSLYDPYDAPNLRDDILKFGRGAHVVVELCCGSSSDAQLCIREIIEDSPSMTAFSSSKSALYKEGLFFAVHIDKEITSPVRSRASLIL